MSGIVSSAQLPPNAQESAFILESSDAHFARDVIEQSQKKPVLVDFQAQWCGPCKQLGPALRKCVEARKGKIALVIIDIDRSPLVAGQLGVKSIPMVLAFWRGQPIDGFTGLIAKKALEQFVGRVLANANAENKSPQEEAIEQGLEQAEALLAAGARREAGYIARKILSAQPGHAKACLILARLALLDGKISEAEKLRTHAEITDTDPRIAEEFKAVEAHIALLRESPPEIKRDLALSRIEADHSDHSSALAAARWLFREGNNEKAFDLLLNSIRQDREWEEQTARKLLVRMMEALGNRHSATLAARKKLSSLLFS